MMKTIPFLPLPVQGIIRSVKRYCDYHPADVARWHCPPCHAHYCTHCMPDGDLRRRQGFCPQCNLPLRLLGSGEGTEPYWQRLPMFFRYPLHKEPLLVMLLCTLALALPMQGMAQLGLIGAVLLALYKYTYAVTVRTAEGKLKPAAITDTFNREGLEVILPQVAMLLLMAALVVWIGHSSGLLAAFLTFALVVFLTPANQLILLTERRPLAAINPLRLTALIAQLGSGYFVLYVQLMLVLLMLGAVLEFAHTHLPDWLGLPLTGLAVSYVLLVLCSLLGYLLLQYRDELGMAEETSTALNGAGRDRSRRRDADIDMALKKGQYDRAQQWILEGLKQRPDDGRRLEQLYHLAMARDDLGNLFRQYRRLLPWMCRQRADAVAPLLNKLLEADPAFRLDDPELAYQCAQVLYWKGEYRLLLQVLKDFHLRFPDFPDLASAYLLAAKALGNGLHQWDKSAGFLKFIQSRCKGHPLQALMPHYLSQAAAHPPLHPPSGP